MFKRELLKKINLYCLIVNLLTKKKLQMKFVKKLVNTITKLRSPIKRYRNSKTKTLIKRLKSAERLDK